MNNILKLAKSDLKVFRTKDLAALWLMDNANTLHTTIKRYVQNQTIFRIQKGLYSFIDPHQISPELIARKLILGHCYLSLESILFESGHRSQTPAAFSFVGNKSQRLAWGDIFVYCRKLDSRYLVNNYQTYIKDGIRRATPLRAICDTLYFNPSAHFDKVVNWREINKLQKALGYPIIKRK
jgi:hypothetical protein